MLISIFHYLIWHFLCPCLRFKPEVWLIDMLWLICRSQIQNQFISPQNRFEIHFRISRLVVQHWLENPLVLVLLFVAKLHGWWFTIQIILATWGIAQHQTLLRWTFHHAMHRLWYQTKSWGTCMESYALLLVLIIHHVLLHSWSPSYTYWIILVIDYNWFTDHLLYKSTHSIIMLLS